MPYTYIMYLLHIYIQWCEVRKNYNTLIIIVRIVYIIIFIIIFGRFQLIIFYDLNDDTKRNYCALPSCSRILFFDNASLFCFILLDECYVIISAHTHIHTRAHWHKKQLNSYEIAHVQVRVYEGNNYHYPHTAINNCSAFRIHGSRVLERLLL